jgi:glycosyltransferase involved in cell wall biosynthesis
VKVLYVNGATMPTLGADAAIHARIFGALNKPSYRLHAACTFGSPARRPPLFELLSAMPHVALRSVDLGPERSRSAELGRTRACLATIPALASIVALAHFVRRERIEIIHTSERPRDAFVGVLLGRLTGATSLLHVHVGYGDWMSPLVKWALRHADNLVAVSQFVRRTLVERGLDEGRVHVVLNAIEPEHWRPRVGRQSTRAALGVPDAAPMIITVCRLFPSKGPDQLIRALAALTGEQPEARLVVVGSELVRGYEMELQELARTLGVSDRVLFTGHRDDVEALMAAADVFAMPSIGEPFGLVFAEAMAMELPVVALDSGGAPEVIAEGITGFLSPLGDLEALTRTIGALLRDSDLRTRMGAAGRRRVHERFTSNRMADDMARVYRRVVGGWEQRTEGDDDDVAVSA